MADTYLIHKDKEYLYKCLKIISELFKSLGLILNKKTKIHKLTNGFIFVKAKYVLTSNGKILHILTTKTFKIIKRKIKKGIDIGIILSSKENTANTDIKVIKNKVENFSLIE